MLERFWLKAIQLAALFALIMARDQPTPRPEGGLTSPFVGRDTESGHMLLDPISLTAPHNRGIRFRPAGDRRLTALPGTAEEAGGRGIGPADLRAAGHLVTRLSTISTGAPR
jgi:hypothetical protein